MHSRDGHYSKLPDNPDEGEEEIKGYTKLTIVTPAHEDLLRF
jgi:hypothetical protein